MIAGIFDRLFKRNKKPSEEELFLGPDEMPLDMGMEMEYADEEGEMQMPMDAGFEYPQFLDEPSELDMNSKIYYSSNKLEYRLTLQNTTEDMVGDVTVHLRTNKKAIVDVLDTKKVIEMIEPAKSATLKFKLKPQYKIGRSGLYGKVEFFEFKSKERKAYRLPQAYVNFELPKLFNKRIDEDRWRVICSGLKSLNIETDTITTPPEQVFDIFKNTLNNLDLYMLPTIENINLYRGIAKFYGFDDDDNQYAVEAQVIGNQKNSKVLFRVWANDMQAGMALAYKTLDVIEGAIKIKEFIIET
jgi:hypothetical protein